MSLYDLVKVIEVFKSIQSIFCGYVFFNNYFAYAVFSSFLLLIDKIKNPFALIYHLNSKRVPIYLILLMLLESIVLDQIVTKNLVKVTVSETQLENNFEAILKALKSHDSSISGLLSKVNTIESTVKEHQLKTETKVKEKEAKIQSSSIEELLKKMMKESETKDLQLKKLKESVSSLEERMNHQQTLSKETNNKVQQNRFSIAQGQEQSKKLKETIDLCLQRLENLQNQEYSVHEQLSTRIDKLEKQLLEQNNKIAMIDHEIKQNKGTRTIKSPREKGTEFSTTQQSFSKMLKELQLKLNEKINDLKKASQSQFQTINGLIQDILKSQINKINEGLNDQKKLSKKLSQDIWNLNEQIYKNQSNTQNQGQNSINSRRLTQLENKLESIRDIISKMNHEGSHMDKNLSTYQKTPRKTEQEWSPAPKKQSVNQKQQAKDINQMKEESLIQERDKGNFKKDIIEKLKQQKGDFNKALKRIDNLKEQKQKVNQLEEKLLKIEHLIDSKIDEQGMKKWTRYIQNKINFLYRIINVESPEEDACIARKNWICLSCDKKLDLYKGKVGNHLISAQLKPKGIEQDVVGGGMLFRSKSKYEMPTVKK